MALTFTINGVARYFQSASLRITRSASGQHRLFATVRSLDGSYAPVERQSLVALDGASRIFAGTIDRVETCGVDNQPIASIDTMIDAVDNNELASRDVFSGKLSAGTLKAQLTQLAPYIPGSVSVAADQDDGPAMAESPYYDYVQIDTVLDDIAKAAGGGRIWEIDYLVSLRCYTPGSGTHVTPLAVTEGSPAQRHDVRVSRDRGQYYNRVVLRYNEQAVAAYAFLSYAAAANFGDGETVTIGSRTYTFQSILTNADGHVQLGANLHGSLANLIAAITLGGTPGTDYAASTTGNTQVTAYFQDYTAMRCKAQTAGASGNSIGVSTTSAGGNWYGEGGIGTSTLVFGSDESLTGVAIAEDAGEQATYGRRTKVLSIASVIPYATALTLAQGWLTYYLAVPTTVVFTTGVAGWFPGQTGTVMLPTRGIASATYLVTDVQVQHVFGSKTEYTVTMVSSSVVPPNWRDIYRQWAAVSGGGSGMGQSIAPTTTSVITLAGDVYLGGARASSLAIVTGGTYQDILDYVEFTPQSNMTVVLHVDLAARGGGATATARLIRTDTGASVVVTSGVASGTMTPVSVPVNLLGGVTYRLQVTSSISSTSVYALGRVGPV